MNILRSPRTAEVIIASTTWIIITFPIWLSPFHPAVAAYLIICFDLYFLYKSFGTAIRATLAYLEIKNHSLVDYALKIRTSPLAADIHHIVIIPNYKESVEKLSATIENILLKSNYPHKDVIRVVLGCEKREEDVSDKVAQIQKRFPSVLATYHELLPEETPGKASNQTFALRQIVREIIEPQHIALDKTLVTICDADSVLSESYFSYLTWEYIHDKGRQYHFYWAAVLFYNNFWQLPFFIRMQATMSSILHLASLKSRLLVHVSTYSANLQLLQDIGFWDVDVISEDWHIYLQAFFKYGERVRTMPLYTITTSDAVYSGNTLKTTQNRYEQEKRWAGGVYDVVYAWQRLFNTPHINWKAKADKFFFILEHHLLWPTSFFILTVAAFVVPLVNPVFKRTVMGYVLPQLSGFLLTLSTGMLILYIIIDIKLRKRLAIDTKWHSMPFLVIQWYLLPIVSFVLSCLPALDAHTRMLLGRKMVYKVTEKV